MNFTIIIHTGALVFTIKSYTGVKSLNGLVVRVFFVVGGGIAVAWNVPCDGIFICKSSVCITIYCQNGERSMTYYCQETGKELCLSCRLSGSAAGTSRQKRGFSDC